MKTQDIFVIGLMTFALFLGAGNLIFPPAMGLNAGTSLSSAMGGFLLTAVGLPTFTIIVLGRIGNIRNLTKALPNWLGATFWVLLFTAIGPAFGMPRAVTVAYEMGIKPFLESDHLLLFSIIFSAITLLLAFKPGNIVTYIGKIITPALILLLCGLGFSAFIHPLGLPTTPYGDYQHSAVTSGLIQGYMTMDAIAAVGFGWVIIQAIKAKGITSQQDIASSSIKVAGIYAVLMSACYIVMGYVGATSATIAEHGMNGSVILTRYVAEAFGQYGQYLLAAIIIMACLTTTVGLTNACAEYYQDTFKAHFGFTAAIIVVLTGVIANFGLDEILKVSLPAILVLCPIAIALTLASFTASIFTVSRLTHSGMLITATLFGTLDAINILGKMPLEFNALFVRYLPLYNANASWLLPSVLILITTVIIGRTSTAEKIFGCVDYRLNTPSNLTDYDYER
ncbi:branched-chain amino acid transport system II carrier protein [Moritella sp. 28]|uniref:branched-chain amino acid transport system II carrier protein n=1 Tax=Moritella sp. 28 TaxID=2746232 RepID=UPI001BA6DB77|nr:branched-chain amino acid transport system II carrier protein [Moritella sp. 28]QUM86267.1 branched-chain amino acid transport system II carrier protein [Moritella sp. 28]